MRVLLVLPSRTYRAEDFVRAAGSIGAELVVASERDQALAEQMGGNFLLVDLDDPEAAAEVIAGASRGRPFDAVVPVDDHGVPVAAQAAARLGLRHNPVAAARATRDKAAMRRAFAAAGLPQPAFRVAHPGNDPAALAAQLGPPVVVKPVSLQAGRGVIRCDDPEEAGRAASRIRRILEEAGRPPGEPLLVEEYLPGQEVAVEGLLRGGRLEVLAVFDKPDPMEGPYFEETILVTPSRHDPSTVDRITELAASATRALGLTEGPVHAELRLTGAGPALLEVAARSIGGLCSRALTFGLLRVSLEEVILRHALGLPIVELEREPAASGVMMLPIPRAGVLGEVRGVEAAGRVPGVTAVEITVARGKRVRPLPEGDRYLGFVFAKAARPEQVEEALRAAAARLEVVIDELGRG